MDSIPSSSGSLPTTLTTNSMSSGLRQDPSVPPANGESYLDKLPGELVGKIADYLTTEQRCILERTCRHIRSQVRQYTSRLSIFNEAGFKTVGDLIAVVERYPNVVDLCLGFIFSTPCGRDAISDPQCNALWEHVKVRERRWRSLGFSSARWSLKDVAFKPSLEKLNLNGNELVTDKHLAKAIEKCDRLREIVLGATECSLEGVVFKPSLEKLKLFENELVTDEYLANAIEDCGNLREINLACTKCSLEGVAFKPSLEKLNLHGNELVTDKHLAEAIEKCDRLREIVLSFTLLSLEGVVFKPSLRKLDVRCSRGFTKENLINSLINVNVDGFELIWICEDFNSKEILDAVKAKQEEKKG